MGVVPVIAARDLGELAHLARRQLAIGNRDPQHRGVALDVESVLQAQRTELILGQASGEISAELVTVLADPLCDQLVVD